MSPRKFNACASWQVVGGKRCYFRSVWEYTYAQHLERQKCLGLIFDWAFEPKTFWFEAIKRGVRSYKPDFRIDLAYGTSWWAEVKGYMDARSKTKLKRMAKYHPDIQIHVIDKNWFEGKITVIGGLVDKKIRKIEKKIKKDTKGEEKELKQLEKMDKKRDKACDIGAEVLKKKKKVK